MTENPSQDINYESYYDDLSFDDFDSYQEDFNLKTRSTKKQKAFVKKIDGLTIWSVGNSKQAKLKDLSSMEIPPRSIKVLSKLIINHQLEEIKSVVKIGTNTTILLAKSNRQNKVYRDLESNDVIIKIFTQKNHTKPDVTAAKNYELLVFSKNRNKGQLPHIGYFDHLTNIDSESLNIDQIENVVILEMVGFGQPARNLIDMIKANPKELQSYYLELLNLVRFFKYRNGNFWILKASMHDILWHNDQWMIINQVKKSNDYNKSDDCIASNLASLVKIFQHYELSTEKLKNGLNDIFENIEESELRYIWKHDKPMRNNEDIKKVHQKTLCIKKLLGHDKCLELLGWASLQMENTELM